MLRFSPPHARLALALFLTEVCIAACVHDRFVRPHLDDLLVVVLMHFTVRAFTMLPRVATALGCLAFAYVVEASQAAHVIAHLGLQHSTAARLILGDTFQAFDLVMYAAGAGVALLIDRPQASAQRSGR